jgi:hypothetical protein
LDGAGSAQLQLSSHNEQLNLLAKVHSPSSPLPWEYVLFHGYQVWCSC